MNPFPLEYEYITVEQSEGHYGVLDSNNHLLGFIEYHDPWDQYVFTPHSSRGVFSSGCLADLEDAIDQIESHEKETG